MLALKADRCKAWVVGILLVTAFLTVGAFAYSQEAAAPAGEEAEEGAAPQGITMWWVLKSGGITMIFIIAGSIVGLALIIEQSLKLRVIKLVPKELLAKMRELVDANNIPELVTFCRETGGFLANVVAAAAGKHGQGRQMVMEAVQDVAGKEVTILNQRISYLSIIGVLEPMLGLLGTVTGMIQTFIIIALGAGMASPAKLAFGVSQALVTTAGGLIVAIPVFGFYYYFKAKVQLLTIAVEDASAEIIGKLAAV